MSRRRCARECRRHHGVDPCGAQGTTRCGQRGPGGDHVVDQQHAAHAGAPCSKRWSSEALCPSATNLWAGIVDAAQKAYTGHTECPRGGPSDQLGMIEPTPLPTFDRGGSPGDDVGHLAGGHDPTGEQTTEVTHRRAPIAVLHCTHHRCRATAVLGGDQHAHPSTDMHAATTGDQRRPTGGAHRSTRLIATGAPDAEHHIGRDRPHATTPCSPPMLTRESAVAIAGEGTGVGVGDDVCSDLCHTPIVTQGCDSAGAAPSGVLLSSDSARV